MIARSVVLFAALAIHLPALAAQIEPARPGARPAADSDEAELWYAMERAERELKQSPLLIRDEPLNKYVRDVACKVAGEFCKDLRVYIVEQPWFNASMAPNGMMLVWSGALLRMRNEAEMALVLGHEFAHFRQRHSLQQWRKVKRTSAFLSSFGILAYGGGVPEAGLAGNLIGAASLYKFSRDKEREADAIGFEVNQIQQYDPQAGVKLWERMQREEEARDYGRPIPVFATHPKTKERVEDVRAAAEKAKPGDYVQGRGRHLQAISPYLEKWLEGELSRRMYATSIRVIDELRNDASDGQKPLYTFYLGEAYRRRNKGDDLQQARALYAQAVQSPNAPAGAWREHGLALREQNQTGDAITALNRYLELSPKADDRGFIEQYLTELKGTP